MEGKKKTDKLKLSRNVEIIGAKSGEEEKCREKKKKDRRRDISHGNSLMGSVVTDMDCEKKRKKKTREVADGFASERFGGESILNLLGSQEVDNGAKKKKNKNLHEPSNVRDRLHYTEVDAEVTMKKKKDKSAVSEDIQTEAAAEMTLDHAKVHSADVKNRKKQTVEVTNGSASQDMQSEVTYVIDSGSVRVDNRRPKKKHSKGTSDGVAYENIQNSSAHSADEVDEKQGSKKVKKRKADAINSSEKIKSRF